LTDDASDEPPAEAEGATPPVADDAICESDETALETDDWTLAADELAADETDEAADDAPDDMGIDDVIDMDDSVDEAPPSAVWREESATSVVVLAGEGQRQRTHSTRRPGW